MFMEQKKELNKLVCAMLDKGDWKPTARELFNECRTESPGLVRGKFKGFVKVLNSFGNVQGELLRKSDDAMVYTNK